MINIDELIDDLVVQLYIETIKTIKEKTLLTDDSRLIQSVEVTKSGNSLQIRMNDYAFYLDKGRKPNAPLVPFKALFQWVLRNRINIQGKSQREVTFMIQRSIRKKGIRPRKFLKLVEQNLEDLGGFIIEEGLRDEIEKSLKDLFIFD
jgi:hypothetical protein